MDGHEELRRRQLDTMRQREAELVERLDWSPERLAEHRTARLRDLVRAAVERSPWHRRRLAGLDVDTLDDAALRDLPVMTKDDLIAHFDGIVTDDRLDLAGVEAHLENLEGETFLFDRYHAIASCGSTGRPGIFVYDWDEWADGYLSLIRHELRAWLGEQLAAGPVTMAAVAAGRPSHGSSAIFQTFSRPELVIERFPVGNPVEEIVDGLNRFRPMVLSGYPTALHGLARHAAAGDLRIGPRRVISYGEPLLPEVRAGLEEAWSAPVCNWWCASEGFALAVSCGAGPWMHLSDDLVIVEPVDAGGRPVPPGVRAAKVYVTNLFNVTMPLIRFELSDEVTVLDTACPCGSAHRLVADVEGRLDETFVHDGVVVHPHVFRSPLGHHRHVLEYQVRQTARGADVLICRDGPVDAEALRAEITEGLSRLVPAPEVRIVEVPSIERHVMGKLERFVPLAAAQR